MKSEDCVCFNCDTHKQIMSGSDDFYDCACESGPFYDEEACGECPHREKCDVAKNPHNYSEYADNGQGQ